MSSPVNGGKVTMGSIEVEWDSVTRVVMVRFAPETNLTGKEASALIDALRRWIGADGGRFALLADADGVRGADAEYRAKTTAFFKQHRDRLYIALFNIGPLIRVLAEMFRVGSGLQVKAFPDEARARDWLREKGIAA